MRGAKLLLVTMLTLLAFTSVAQASENLVLLNHIEGEELKTSTKIQAIIEVGNRSRRHAENVVGTNRGVPLVWLVTLHERDHINRAT